jgi:predicted house-cleaning noncanonical NTP pyrophosphatase (MazG superfamily)
MKPGALIVKLVRDRIPEIVSRDRGKKEAAWRRAGRQEFVRLLRRKLQEEVDEYLESGKVEELADILEVLRALAGTGGLTPRDLETVRRRKARARGGFQGRKVMSFKKVT